MARRGWRGGRAATVRTVRAGRAARPATPASRRPRGAARPADGRFPGVRGALSRVLIFKERIGPGRGRGAGGAVALRAAVRCWGSTTAARGHPLGFARRAPSDPPGAFRASTHAPQREHHHETGRPRRWQSPAGTISAASVGTTRGGERPHRRTPDRPAAAPGRLDAPRSGRVTMLGWRTAREDRRPSCARSSIGEREGTSAARAPSQRTTDPGRPEKRHLLAVARSPHGEHVILVRPAATPAEGARRTRDEPWCCQVPTQEHRSCKPKVAGSSPVGRTAMTTMKTT